MLIPRDVVFVCAPQGAGKTMHAKALMTLLGCTSIVDAWDGWSVPPDGALVLTNMSPMRVTLVMPPQEEAAA